jgi:hypothetical protein
VSVVRVGATKKFTENWDSIFTKGKKSAAPVKGKKAVKPVPSAKKIAGKKAKKRK